MTQQTKEVLKAGKFRALSENEYAAFLREGTGAPATGNVKGDRCAGFAEPPFDPRSEDAIAASLNGI